MPKVDIVNNTADRGYGTVIKLDGVELHDVTEIRLAVTVDAVPRVDVSVLASEQLNITTAADVHVSC